MKTFYEEYRDEDEHLEIRRNGNYIFPAHFHRNLEILAVQEGMHRVTLNGKAYEAGAGDVFFCGSFNLHSFEETKQERRNDCLIIVPTRITARFNERNKGMRPACPVVHDTELCREIIQIADRWMIKGKNCENVRAAATELFLSLIETRLNMVPGKEKDETQLIREILSYLSEHFREDVSLPKIARRFGYAEAHISRVFHRYVTTGLPRYVNRLRLHCVESEMRNSPEADLTRAIFDAGFKSVPTYYRAKAQNQSVAVVSCAP
ncbi:MAG: AraC family ligand binding domain-containing protein [Candidatus Scatosoma sp.]